MCTDHQCYVSSGSIRKDAHKFFNCISVPIFDIPVSQVFELNTMQVCPPGLHIILGIFTKCWKLYVVNWIWNWHLIQLISTLSNFSKYSQALQRLPLLQGDLKTDSAFTGSVAASSNICGLSSWRGKPSLLWIF